ncbi:AAEL010638-PA [Aedes aegypti]|uniref:AAEL010638-PA n=1 Tax=Aedes aegypti TaxID=7159 RepID=Q16SC0_AEDAE|nr:AAEL010638-PA [Aedes aegypti]
MSQSEEETSGTESPFLKSRAVTRSESSSEEYESEQDGSVDEAEEQPDEAEKETVQPKVPKADNVLSSAPKPNESSSTPKTANRAIRPVVVKSKSYDVMLLEAMNALDENKKSGVSIKSVMKYVQDNIKVRENFKMHMFKKAIDKALLADLFVHTSGTGMTGSIAFSAAQKKSRKLQKAKEIKAAEKKAISDAKTKEKHKPKAIKKASKPKGPSKDKNNNSTEAQGASKKTTGKGKKARLSVTLLPTIKAKPKPKAKPKAAPKPKSEPTKATSSKEMPKAVSTEAADQNTKGRTRAGPAKPTATKEKPANSKK